MVQKLVTFTVLFVLSFSIATGQEQPTQPDIQQPDIFSRLQDDSHGGDIDFYQNPSLHVLIDKSTRLNEKNGLIGYRIQIYSGLGANARENSQKVKDKFLEEFPEFDNNRIYFDYHAPYFRVKVGDFRNKSEAYVIYQEIKESFPSSYIVKNRINFPDLGLPESE